MEGESEDQRHRAEGKQAARDPRARVPVPVSWETVCMAYIIGSLQVPFQLTLEIFDKDILARLAKASQKSVLGVGPNSSFLVTVAHEGTTLPRTTLPQ